MKSIYSLLLITGLSVAGAGLVLSLNGCDEIQAPCDIEETSSGYLEFDTRYLESSKIENGYRIFRLVYPKQIVLFVCTDRVLTYSVTIDKLREGTVFEVLPQARLVWKYAAPSPSKAVLTGLGSYKPLFSSNVKTTTIIEDQISLAYSESTMGGYFIPGLEIKIPTLGNLTDDYNYVYQNFLLFSSYEVDYRLYY